MNSLRFLLVHSDPGRAERISSVLANAHHTVLPTSGLEEAGEALFIERFDAVLLGTAVSAPSLAAFSAKLRRVEESQAALRIPILGFGDERRGDVPVEESGCDGYLEEPLDPAAVTEAVTLLAQAIGQPSHGAESSGYGQFPVLEPDKFREQVGDDNELMIEIIDLFLEEREKQVAEMHEFLVRGDWELLSRVAHTIKGSLGSLHATRARATAQLLELAAHDRQGEVCEQTFIALERDLIELDPELAELRQKSFRELGG